MADYMRFFSDAHAKGIGLCDEQRARLMKDAIISYCEARQVLPISREEYETHGDPLKCSPRLPLFAAGTLIEEMDGGKPANEAFESAFAGETSNCVWRVMLEDERMKPGQLLGIISEKARAKAMEVFGVCPRPAFYRQGWWDGINA